LIETLQERIHNTAFRTTYKNDHAKIITILMSDRSDPVSDPVSDRDPQIDTIQILQERIHDTAFRTTYKNDHAKIIPILMSVRTDPVSDQDAIN
jgi:hypothetical protein